MSENNTKLEFLYAAIVDAQETIRFVENKLTVAITIIAGFMVGIFTTIDKIVQCKTELSGVFWLSLVSLIILITLCIIIIVRIITPTTKAHSNINIQGIKLPFIDFYISPNNYKKKAFAFYNDDEFKLSKTLNTYHLELKEAKDEDFINSLSYEVLKINFIRNIKRDRLRVLVNFLVATTIAFFAFYIFYSIETQQILSKLLEATKK
jgi:hypothetical protein